MADKKEAPKGKAKATSDDVIKDALERFDDSWQGSEHNRAAYYEDFKFARLEEQWPDAIKKQRVQEARPVLVINRLPAFIRAIVNESRQNKPAIRVSPVDNGADEDTAEVIGGLVRSIERMSNADVAYDTAIDQAVTGGFGYFAIEIDYAHDETFDLEARIRRIPNALQVNHDTSSTEFDASDWGFGFISEMMSKDEYKRSYPEGSLVPFDSGSRDDAAAQWLSEDQIRVAEYFLREPKTRTLIQFAIANPETGQTDLRAIREEDLPGMAKRFFEAGGIKPFGGSDIELAQQFISASGMKEQRRRDVEYFKVMRRIINGVEVLEEEEWPGSRIPICPVWGDEVYLDGKRHFISLIRGAKDSQAMFNFWRSATTELVALAPKAPWVGPKGFIPKGQESKWESANTRSHAYLEYDPVAGAAAPARTPFAGVPAGAMQEALTATEDMQAIMGIYPSSIGARSNETSGKAILARERQGDISNFHFIDNLSRAIRYAGSILVEIIPAVYSARESIRILGEDETENVIKLTQEAGGALQKGAGGKPQLYNLTVGKYDVDVKTGPSFATQREETRETLIEIGKQVPEAMPFIADVLMDHMDFVGADKIAKRMRHLLPPEVRQEEDAAGNEDNPEAAALQQKLQMQGKQFQQVQQQVMAEVEKIKAENEALKRDKSAQAMKAQADAEAKKAELALKARELALKEGEAAAKVTPEQQWDYDRQVEEDKYAFEAVQNEKDRQVDLAKTIISNAEEGDTGEAMVAAGDEAMQQALALLSAPRRVIRDENGNIIGTEVVVQ